MILKNRFSIFHQHAYVLALRVYRKIIPAQSIIPGPFHSGTNLILNC